MVMTAAWGPTLGFWCLWDMSQDSGLSNVIYGKSDGVRQHIDCFFMPAEDMKMFICLYSGSESYFDKGANKDLATQRRGASSLFLLTNGCSRGVVSYSNVWA